MTFKEVASELEKALIVASESKSKLNEANKVLQQAGEDYQHAVARAADMRSQMNALLDQSLPPSEIKPKIG